MVKETTSRPGPADRAYCIPARGRLASPYLAPGFYEQAIAAGRHRDIVGGRWDETGRVQMQLLHDAGLKPHHRLLDIGAGGLRLGCRAVPYLNTGHYWATDASGALMQHGRLCELADPGRLPESHLVEDADFAFPGIPSVDMAIAFAVFTHLPSDMLDRALTALAARFPDLEMALVTVFLAPDGTADQAQRQPDGVVTHPDRPPYHRTASSVATAAKSAGFQTEWSSRQLPRGQRCAVFTRESIAQP